MTEAQLHAAFMAARKHGVILHDEVIRDIVTAVDAWRVNVITCMWCPNGEPLVTHHPFGSAVHHVRD